MEENIDNIAANTSLPEPNNDAPDDKGTKKFVTAGTKIQNWGTYLSVDWILNAASGVTFAYVTKYTESGKKYWSGPITNFFKKSLSPFIKNAEQVEKSAGYGNMFMSIIAGGMFTIPPLLALENNKVKRKLAEFWDKQIYGKDKVENDSKFQQAYQDIEDAPKKDFWNGMKSRFVALAPLLAVVLIPKTKEVTSKYYFDYIEEASSKAGNALGYSEKSFKEVPVEEAKTRWKFIHESMAMDAGLGIPYAGLHAIFYNLFTGKKPKETSSGPSISPTMSEVQVSQTVPQKPNDVQTKEVAQKASIPQTNIMPQSSEIELEMLSKAIQEQNTRVTH